MYLQLMLKYLELLRCLTINKYMNLNRQQQINQLTLKNFRNMRCCLLVCHLQQLGLAR